MILLFDNAESCEKFSARFWSKVDRNGGPSACWPWLASKTRNGCGQFSVNRRMKSAHRVAWSLANGPIPDRGRSDAICVCHTCDVSTCMNPRHMFLGSHGDNVADKVAKGRQPKGSGIPWAKLDERLVSEIRQRASGGERLAPIARSAGVTVWAIKQVVRGHTWKHVH